MAVPPFHLHLVSDATGETLESISNAAIAQFDAADVQRHFWPMIRTAAHMDRVMDDIVQRPGLVLYTLVNEDVRDVLLDRAGQANLRAVSVLDPVITALGQYLQREASHRPGGQHRMNERYFRRIEAMDFTMMHDDGNISEHLAQADIILVGVSRTSKTPTSIYLANRGYKVANVPFVPGRTMPDVLDQALPALIVGLTSSPKRLSDIRGNRLAHLNQDGLSDYADFDAIKEEVRLCRRYCSERDWPVIDVTRRSIEETAAEILKLYKTQREKTDET